MPTSKGLSKKRKFANINVAAVMLAGNVKIDIVDIKSFKLLIT